MYLGTALVFAAWWNGLIAGLVMLGYALKAKLEDDFLACNLPGYQDYCQRVRHRLVPGLW